MGTFVTPEGLKRKTLQEIRLEIEQALKQAFGPSFETSVDSPNGLLINQLALAFSSHWELAQEVFVSRDPAQATGVALDWAAALSNVTRKFATACKVEAMLYTDQSSASIPAGAVAMRPRGNLEFTLNEPVAISRTGCDELLIMDDGSKKNTEYVFHFTFGDVTLNNNTLQDNLSRLNTLILAAGGRAISTNRGLRVYMADNSSVGILDALPNDFDIWAGSEGNFTAVSTGYQTCEAGELTDIPNAVSGWVALYNYQAGVPGTDVESDYALRLRRAIAAKSIRARGTDPAIASHIVEEVPGVITTVVKSNRSMVTDESTGRPPKSFESLVVGGEDQAVARCIYENQPSGIQSYGNVSVTIVDDNNDEQVISFSRPVAKYLWLKITYTPYTEEVTSTDAEIKAALLKWAEGEYTMGKDVIPDRVKSGLYDGTTGIGPATVQVAVTATATGAPSYGSSVISIQAAEYATLAESRITLVRNT